MAVWAVFFIFVIFVIPVVFVKSNELQNIGLAKPRFRNTRVRSTPISWSRGSTGVPRYGCIPRSAANNLGQIPQKLGAPNPLFCRVFLGGNTLGLVPASLPHTLGYACTFYAPTSPLQNFTALQACQITNPICRTVKSQKEQHRPPPHICAKRVPFVKLVLYSRKEHFWGPNRGHFRRFRTTKIAMP